MRLSISQLWRAEPCPGSTVLPAVQSVRADSERGRALHAEREASAPAGSIAEVAFAYDVASDTAREIGRGSGRNYAAANLRPTEIPGTLDLMTVEADRIVVDDYKSGAGYHVSPARSNLQLHAYALAACRANRRSRALVRLQFVDQGRTDEAELDAFDLAAVARRLRDIWDESMRAQAALAQGREPKVVAGDHCWRCPCFARCPAQTHLALALATGSAPNELPVIELSPTAVATGWPKLMAYKKLLGEVERVYRAYAHGEPVKLSDGRWLGPRAKKREELDGAITVQVLRELHGAEVAAEAAEISTSKAAIERAIAKVAKRGEKAGMVRAALDRVAAAGGINAKWTTTVEEYDAEEPA